MNQEHLPLRAITIYEERNAGEYSFLGARLLENGDLILEGQDIGDASERIFGEREYEYSRSRSRKKFGTPIFLGAKRAAAPTLLICARLAWM